MKFTIIFLPIITVLSYKIPLNQLSSVVGYSVIGTSSVYKVPQITRIFKKKSVKGLSKTMFGMETVAGTLSLAFCTKSKFPFSTYGEGTFILAQNIAILYGLALYGKKNHVFSFIIITIIGTISFFLLNTIIPLKIVSMCQILSIAIVNIARLPQIRLNYKQRNTGELAPSTLIIQMCGNIARVFTTIIQVKDTLVLLSALLGTLFCGILVIQYFLYRTNKEL
jgi:mannose-P-dolichol utilization defect protein 1